ncbi:MAG: arylamine N-acetyltransferase [Woeseiaceae bacterium]|nr:arylamine N-acetyltransferase [Woeseiaceae bacterium]
MRLDAYFERVGFGGRVAPTIETLFEVQRRHALTVPFENLDVQLGRSLTTDVGEAYAKIVERGRGGWCYEQNGLLGWALGELGFDVTRVAAAVMQQQRGDIADANHLCLLVRTPDDPDTVYLADVGFGGSLLEPIELAAADFEHAPFRLGLRQLGSARWRYYEDGGDGEFSFDFTASAGDETVLSNRCRFLQTHPESSFVLNLVAQLRVGDEHRTLRGRVLTVLTPDGSSTRQLDSADELVTTLAELFGIDVPEVADLWPRIVARHREVFGEE